MDDDIASLIGLMLILDPFCRERPGRPHIAISPLCLSLYLMTQCQIKLNHSVTSLEQTLGSLEVSRQQVSDEETTLDVLLLKLTEQKILSYMKIQLLPSL